MLISKRSPKRSELFESKFRKGEGIDFPLRQYMRCREEFNSGLIHLVLLVTFVVILASFGNTIQNLFDRHGADINDGYRWLSFGMLFLFILTVCRRVYCKARELRDLRAEMRHLQEQMSRSQD